MWNPWTCVFYPWGKHHNTQTRRFNNAGDHEPCRHACRVCKLRQLQEMHHTQCEAVAGGAAAARTLTCDNTHDSKRIEFTQENNKECKHESDEQTGGQRNGMGMSRQN